MKREVCIVGHRGAEGYATENTLLSFKKAIEMGCGRTELDVSLTKDKQAVVFHDDFLSRVSNSKGFIKNKTLKDLKKVCLKGNQKIPTLQEVIDLCKGKIELQIELKDKGTAEIAGKLIIKKKILRKVVVTSFFPEYLKEIKEFDSRIKAGLLFDKLTPSVWRIVKKNKLEYLGPRGNIVSKEMVDKAHEKGLKVYAWGVNDKGLFERLVKMGVEDIGTNFPKKFL